jgi:hypothetical protein
MNSSHRGFLMNRFHIIGRLAVIVAGLAGALVGLGAGAVPAAFAAVMVPLGGDPHGRPGHAGPPVPAGGNQPPLPAHAHAVASSGISGWQIALIVAGAVLLSAALTVICYRVRDARRRVTVSAT